MGDIHFHEWLGDSWGILFSHPKVSDAPVALRASCQASPRTSAAPRSSRPGSPPQDYTPVCTTELGYMEKILPEFHKRGVKVLALSVDSTDEHYGWSKDIMATQGVSSLTCACTVLCAHGPAQPRSLL